ncbi:MAG: tripartite tricarboxylate transporter substrate binding protein [Betaproteobacteria bacterium]|nr:tripartite tricarboxylate transporter substrate binding protein [Betaproteobacteria bacterium]
MMKVRFAMIVAGAIVVCASAFAQAPLPFPAKPIRLITLTPAGGALDILARTLGQKISEQMGQQVVVENRVGGGGNIGAEAVARSAPDGYTIGMVTSSTHGINPSLYGAKMPFDAIRDFSPITVAAELKNVVVVNPAVPAKNMQELVAHARANPGKVAFGSAGAGTSQHLAGEMVKMITQTDMVHVPYKGAAQAIPDLLSGQIQLMFVSIPDAIAHIRSGRLRAIGITSLARSGALPDQVPVAEQGFPGFDVRAWFGVVAPAGTPRDIVNRYNQVIVAALSQPEVRERLTGIGLDPVTLSPEQFAAFIREEIAKWAPVVKASGARVD